MFNSNTQLTQTVNAYLVLAEVCNGQKSFADTEPVLAQGVRRSPGSWQYACKLGVAYFGLEQYSKAESECRSET